MFEAIAIAADRGLVAAHAMVTDSHAMRTLITAVGWMVKIPFTNRVFVDPGEALDWLHEQFPVDRIGILEAVLSDVPADQRDPTLPSLLRRYVEGTSKRHPSRPR
jgi:hypothetical protein